MRKTRVIIAGGGIGGLSMAIALDKIGLDYMILERSQKISDVGAGIVIGSNGVNCLKELDVKNAFEEKAAPINAFHFQDQRSKILTKVDISDFNEQFGATMSVIRRTDLINILLQSVNSDKILLNSEVQSFFKDSQGIILNLNSGKIIRGDLLIGADGLRSVIRKGLPNYRKPRYSGYTCWRGIVTMPHEVITKGIGISGIGSGNQFGLLPLKENQVYWFVAKIEKSDKSKALNLDSLKGVISNYSKNIRDIIEKTSPNAIIRNDIFDLVPKKFWGNPYCTLIGDAAHAATPNLGQGASTALEDSIELAHSLLHCPNMEQALKNFEKRRYNRTTDIIKTSRLIGKVYQWRHPLLTRFRNFSISLTPWITKWILKKYASYSVPVLRLSTKEASS